MKGCIQALLFVFLTALLSCTGNGKQPLAGLETNNELPSGKEGTSIKIQRFEQDLFSIDVKRFQEDTTKLRKKYGTFLELYFNRIVRLGGLNNPMFKQNLDGFVHDPDIQSVYQAVQAQFKSLENEQKQIAGAFERYRVLYPDSLIPAIYTMLSGFSYTIVTADSALAIGLDMYLGADSHFYELLGLPNYKKMQMRRERLVNDVVRAYLLSSWEMQDPHHDLVTRMIYQGKILYLTSLLLPEESEASILGYTEKELTWCKENEAKVWSHFIDRKLFYSTDFNDELAYINDGPFTKGFPDEAPARIGVWLGLQLVKSFMIKGDYSPQELMAEKDARKIFSQSKYKPGRAT